MLDADRNRMLMEVGAGTPMGEVMRRYWHPIAAETEFSDKNTKPVRLLGENLVLYKDLSGTYGLLDRHCPHRRADLSYGYVEQHGLRCNYHGWLFGENGACLAQHFDDAGVVVEDVGLHRGRAPRGPRPRRGTSAPRRRGPPPRAPRRSSRSPCRPRTARPCRDTCSRSRRPCRDGRSCRYGPS